MDLSALLTYAKQPFDECRPELAYDQLIGQALNNQRPALAAEVYFNKARYLKVQEAPTAQWQQAFTQTREQGQISAQQIILSGCETGLSQINTGDAPLGLVPAWLYAGDGSFFPALLECPYSPGHTLCHC